MVFPRPLSQGASPLELQSRLKRGFRHPRRPDLFPPSPLQGTCALSRNFNRAASALSVIPDNPNRAHLFPPTPVQGACALRCNSNRAEISRSVIRNSPILQFSRNSAVNQTLKNIEILQFSGNSAANHQNYSQGWGWTG